MNKVQQATGLAVRDHLIASLNMAAGVDENLEAIRDKCGFLGNVDTAACDVELFFSDKLVQEAFRKFISATIGCFQLAGDDGIDPEELALEKM